MTREIKVRGKSPYTSKWLYGALLTVDGETAISEGIIRWEDGAEMSVMDWGYVAKDSIGQYTGIIDKARQPREVYEHDLYEVNGVLCEIVYNSDIASFVLLEVRTQELGTTPIGVMFSMFPTTYKGNIHDNPELMED